MRRSIVPEHHRPAGGPRWRARAAALLVAGLAMAGVGLASAMPAAAEDEPIPALASTLEVTATACGTYHGEGSLHYVVRDPFPAYQDFITVTDATDQVVHSATYLDETEFTADVPLPPGDYLIRYTAERETHGIDIDLQSFTIGACPDVDVMVTPLSCSTAHDGITFITFTGLLPGQLYGFQVAGPGFDVAGPFEAESDIEEREIIGMPPGNYYVYVQWIPPDGQEAPAPMFDWIAFAVDPCQPAVTVAVTQCTAAGGTGGVQATLSRLVTGVEYTVRITDAGDPDGTTYGAPQVVTGDESGEASAAFSALPAGRSFTIRVDGAWTAEPYEEPPFVGGGDFVPLTTVELTTGADASLAPCPAAPATPASATTLPATGPDGVDALLAGAFLMLALGATLVLVSGHGVRRD